jgi:hypothetical protein
MFVFLTVQRLIVPLQPLLLQCLELLIPVKIHFRLLHPLLCPGGDPGDKETLVDNMIVNH